MLHGRLEKDQISQPELWRLALMISDTTLDVALYPPVAREEIIWRSFTLDPNAPSRLRAIEDIIYDNPLLLCDFKRIDCLLALDRYAIVPQSTSASESELIFSASHPDSDTGNELRIFDTHTNAKVLQAIDSDSFSFLSRTFYNIRFRSRIALLASYFADNRADLSPKRAILLLRNKKLTLLALDDNRLLAANEFRYNTNADAAYYTMAALQNIGFAPQSTDFDIALYGELLNQPDNLAEILRLYIHNIKAIPFPTLRYRASKATLQSPFPLLILPACE